MRSIFVAVGLAVAAGPIIAETLDEPARPTTSNSARTSVVLTPQGFQRQATAQTSVTPTLANIDVPQRPLLPARPTFMDVVTSLACTSMFARRPDTQGTDPAASAGR